MIDEKTRIYHNDVSITTISRDESIAASYNI